MVQIKTEELLKQGNCQDFFKIRKNESGNVEVIMIGYCYHNESDGYWEWNVYDDCPYTPSEMYEYFLDGSEPGEEYYDQFATFDDLMKYVKDILPEYVYVFSFDEIGNAISELPEGIYINM